MSPGRHTAVDHADVLKDPAGVHFYACAESHRQVFTEFHQSRLWLTRRMHSSTTSTARLHDWVVSAAIVGLAIAFIVRTVWLMDRGFDFTDQSFYLAWAQQPTAFDIAYGLFGYGLHPLFDIFNGSIASFRRAAAVILVILGIIAGLIAIGSTRIDRRGPTGLQLIAVSGALPFAYYVSWVVTPSYNWFALAGGLVSIGAMLDLCDPRHALRSAATTALAFVLLIFARPQNAIACLGIYLLAIVIVVPTWRGKLLQTLRTACLAAILIAAVAAVAPLHTIANQVRAYIAIFGTNNPTDASLVGKQLEFFRRQGVWIAFSSLLFVGSLITVRDKMASEKLRTRLVISGALIASIVTLIQFRTGGSQRKLGRPPGCSRLFVSPWPVCAETQIFACLPCWALQRLFPWLQPLAPATSLLRNFPSLPGFGASSGSLPYPAGQARGVLAPPLLPQSAWL
jgi:hypothetical protein